MAEYRYRLQYLKDAIRRRSLDSLFVTNKINVSYISGFGGEDAMALITPRKNYFITDSRYSEEARKTLKGFSIEVVTSTTYETLKSIIAKEGLRTIGFESMDLAHEVVHRLKTKIKPARFVATKNVVETKRAIKGDEEIALIKKAISCAKKTLRRMANRLRPGASESDISRYAEIDFLKKGGRAAFLPIVAVGKNSSKPHARPGNARITANSFVMIDVGCTLNGYNSDLTRMFFLGRIKDSIKKIYGIVHHAQARAISIIRPGVKMADVDNAARSFIDEQGYGKYFGHALGHGVGLEVHEQPTISRLNTDALRAGMVFTVEPAIYIPNVGGVRIEDMVLVTKDGCEVLTR